MARSISKGPYVDANLNKKVEAIAEGKAKKGKRDSCSGTPCRAKRP